MGEQLQSEHLELETLAIRGGKLQTGFNEHSEAMFLTSSFVFDNAAQAAARFSGAEDGYVYARFSNPTVAMLQDRLAALDGAEACYCTATGMSAILAVVMGMLKAGDHVVTSRGLFGTTRQLFANVLPRFGIETTFVSQTDTTAWEAAIRPNTRLFFIETPSNPLTEIADVPALTAMARQRGILSAVDNSFCTPILQRPILQGADLVVYSATKFLEGQGRVLGGAVTGSKVLLEEVYKFLRIGGPSLSAFNAWVILKGIETLSLRMKAHSENALKVAQWLEHHPRIGRVFYPGLVSHPQHELAQRLQAAGGAVVAFEVLDEHGQSGGREEAWRVVDACRLISVTANLGDVKSTITHPSTTTHGRVSAEDRLQAGITEGILRVSVGLENVADIMADLERGLSRN